MLPLPTGGGRKPMFVRRMRAIWCSAVQPCLSALTSAPWSIRNAPELPVAVLRRQHERARAVGQRVVHVRAGLEQRPDRFDLAELHGEEERGERRTPRGAPRAPAAPVARREHAASAPVRARRAPRLRPSARSTSAPPSTSTLIAAALFSAAAHISAVCPRVLSRAFGSAP